MSLSIDAIDAVASCIAKAQGVISLISNDCQDLSEGFQTNQRDIMNAIWAVSDLLEQARQEILNNGSK